MGGSWFEASSRQIVQEILSQKYPTQNRASGVAQVVAYLPSKHEVLSTNPSTVQKTKREDWRETKGSIFYSFTSTELHAVTGKKSRRSLDLKAEWPKLQIWAPKRLGYSCSSVSCGLVFRM
jgi:hypothetical protein